MAERPGRRVMPNAVRQVQHWAGARRRSWYTDRIGAGIAGFDVIDAKIVEHVSDRKLVGQREIDAVGLRAVTQRGVEQIKTLAGHNWSHHR